MEDYIAGKSRRSAKSIWLIYMEAITMTSFTSGALFVLLAMAIVCAAIHGGYMVGYKRGKKDVRL